MSGSDSFECEQLEPAIKLMIHMDSMEHAMHTVSVLSAGGIVLSPLRPHLAPDDGGCGAFLKDRFGYQWIITCPNPEKQGR